MIDIAKRKKIMQRSIALGHCICNPKIGCPCKLFKEKNVCHCAGERLEDAPENIPLTSLVENTGCASKISQGDLKRVLEGLPKISHPDLLVGSNTCDDAGVYRISDDLALVQTVDVFTPLVDDPYTFGQVAAANSVSDIYAMGGTPLTALSVIAFPIETMNPAIMTHILRGGMDKLAEANVTVVGGHSLKGEDIKFGYAVTGLIHPKNIVTNSNAKAGDLLILTKPLGVGAITFANQLGRANKSHLAQIDKAVIELNRKPAELMVEMGVRTATDVTGFSLLGHLGEMVSQSSVSAELYFDQIPAFEGALDYLKAGMISGAIERNREFSEKFVVSTPDLPDYCLDLLYDPQTSGGLLISIKAEDAPTLLDKIKRSGAVQASIIGKIIASDTPKIKIKSSASDGEIPLVQSPGPIVIEPPEEEFDFNQPCCDNPPGDDDSPIATTYGSFMGSAFGAGEISLENKELMSIALSIVTKCEECLTLHIAKARSLKISEDKIDEAIWMAVAFGGAPAKMFYNKVIG